MRRIFGLWAQVPSQMPPVRNSLRCIYPLTSHSYSHSEVPCVEQCERYASCGHPCTAMCRDNCFCNRCDGPREIRVELTYAECPPPEEEEDSFAAPARYVMRGEKMETRDIRETQDVRGMRDNREIRNPREFIRPHQINAGPSYERTNREEPRVLFDPEFTVTSVTDQPLPPQPVTIQESFNLIDLEDDDLFSTPTPSVSSGRSLTRQTVQRPSSPPHFPSAPPPPIPPAHTRPGRKIPEAQERPRVPKAEVKRPGNAGSDVETWPALGASGPTQKRSQANWAQRAGRRG